MNRHIPSKNSISRGFQRSQLQITSISRILTIPEERPRNDIPRERIILRQSLSKTNNSQHPKWTILRHKHTSRGQMEPNQTAKDPPQSTHHPSCPRSLGRPHQTSTGRFQERQSQRLSFRRQVLPSLPAESLRTRYNALEEFLRSKRLSGRCPERAFRF